jgi:hypothetical protein
VVAIDSEAPARRHSFVEIGLALVLAVVLVAAIFAIGQATGDDDDGVAATDGDAAGAPVTADPAATSADGHAHAESSDIDDRGFARLQNGEEHPHEFTQPVTPEERTELARQLTLAREVALQYPTVADAEAAGLRRAGPFSPGLGAHYINFKGLGNADGVMSDDDIRAPLAWIYDGTKPDSPVAGLFYMSSKADAEGFAGPNDTWHVHNNICIKVGANGVVDAPLGADRGATKEQCDAVGGNLLEQTQYLLHVWTVPGYESPEGVFAHLSSAVTCDDGTYNTIEDLTKVGAATTVCADGTE